MPAPTRWSVRRRMTAVGAVVALVVALAVVLAERSNKDMPMPDRGR